MPFTRPIKQNRGHPMGKTRTAFVTILPVDKSSGQASFLLLRPGRTRDNPLQLRQPLSGEMGNAHCGVVSACRFKCCRDCMLAARKEIQAPPPPPLDLARRDVEWLDLR
jgi:hypothetical protein